MKKALNIIFIVIGVLVLALYGVRTYTKSHSPFEKLIAKGKRDLKVELGYCRPLMKERKIFGELIPYNTVWRTGANEATTESVVMSIEELLNIDNQYYASQPISIAMGYAMSELGENMEQMLKRADQMMYRKKKDYYNYLAEPWTDLHMEPLQLA